MLLRLHLHFQLSTWFRWIWKDNCKTRRETFTFWELLWLIIGVWRYVRLQILVDKMLSKEVSIFPSICRLIGIRLAHSQTVILAGLLMIKLWDRLRYTNRGWQRNYELCITDCVALQNYCNHLDMIDCNNGFWIGLHYTIFMFNMT